MKMSCARNVPSSSDAITVPARREDVALKIKFSMRHEATMKIIGNSSSSGKRTNIAI